MANSIILSPLAKRELEESHDWYEERLSGLGTRFILKINDSLEVISKNPEAFPRKTKLLSAMAVSEFPYLIIYQLVKKENLINVIHVFHTSRNPKLKYKK